MSIKRKLLRILSFACGVLLIAVSPFIIFHPEIVYYYRFPSWGYSIYNILFGVFLLIVGFALIVASYYRYGETNLPMKNGESTNYITVRYIIVRIVLFIFGISLILSSIFVAFQPTIMELSFTPVYHPVKYYVYHTLNLAIGIVMFIIGAILIHYCFHRKKDWMIPRSIL